MTDAVELDEAVVRVLRRARPPRDRLEDERVVQLMRQRLLGGGDVTRVNRFELVSPLGRGAMGTVYLARDPGLQRDVALKVLREMDANLIGPLRAEARAMARIEHPNLVTIYEAGDSAEGPFIAMQYAAGGSLHDRLVGKPLALLEVLSAFCDAAQGLSALHRSGIVHRDFKPQNVLFDGEGRALVADFGLSLERSSPAGPTRGRFAGTPGYMAPEVQDGGDATFRSDQYSFCASLYEALYAEQPERAYPVPAPARPHGMGSVPQRLRQLLSRGLSPTPSDRFESIDAVHDELTRCLAGARLLSGATDAGGSVVAPSDPAQLPEGFELPDFSEPVDLEARLAALPPDINARGVLFRGIVQRAEDASGRRPATARDRYLPFVRYPVSEYLVLLVEATTLAYPELPPRDGIRRLAHAAYDAGRASIVGSVLAAMAGGDFGRLVLRVAQVYGALSTGQVVAVPRGPCEVELRLRNLWTFPETYHYGIFERLLDSEPVTGELLLRRRGMSEVDLLMRWCDADA